MENHRPVPQVTAPDWENKSSAEPSMVSNFPDGQVPSNNSCGIRSSMTLTTPPMVLGP
jgi:hypothetical protein